MRRWAMALPTSGWPAQAPPAADAVARRDLPALIDVWNRTLPAAAGLLTKVSSFDDLLINTGAPG
jgi:hypothetical protein